MTQSKLILSHMSDRRLYTTETRTLSDLLDQMHQPPGSATLLLPDLQRDFVWDPAQIILLVDSLLKGWPFGTLLLWSQDPGQGQMNFRSFWTNWNESDPQKSRAPAPHTIGPYTMVLDGQQRLQALLLAFGGNSYGMTLSDKLWYEVLKGERVRGRSPRQWSSAELCVDVAAFTKEYDRVESFPRLSYADFLQWAVCNPAGTGPKIRTAGSQDGVVPIAEGHSHLRLSDLWEIAQPVADYKGMVAAIAAKWPLPDQLLTRLAELTRALADLKRTDVAVSRVFSKNEAYRNGYPKEEYDEAVVEIFVRLNGGGTELTKDEITLSWIKHFWGAGGGHGDAKRNFENLLEDLKEQGVSVKGLGEIAALAATFWACQPGGQVLAPRDLLSVGKVRPMAEWLRSNWTGTVDSFLDCAKFLVEQGVAYGSEYNSLNALAILAAWYFRVCERAATARPSMLDAPRETLKEFAVRWMAATTWAGNWQSRSGPVRENYASSLRAAGPNELKELMRNWLDSTAEDGRDNLMALGVTDRAQVRQYLMALRIWNDLTPRRQECARLALRAGRGREKTEVDHIVSVALAGRLGGVLSDEVVNALGNCALLHKNFNIAKSDRPLADFLSEADAPKDFAPTLGIDDRLARPSNASEIVAAIKERDEKIKAEIASHVWPAALAAGA